MGSSTLTSENTGESTAAVLLEPLHTPTEDQNQTPIYTVAVILQHLGFSLGVLHVDRTLGLGMPPPRTAEATPRKRPERASSNRNAASERPAAGLKRQMWGNSSSNSQETLWHYRPSWLTSRHFLLFAYFYEVVHRCNPY